MAKTSNPTLLLVILAGLSAGLWLAARSGGEFAKASAIEPNGAGPTDAAAIDAPNAIERDPASHLETPETAQVQRTRPRADASKVLLIPKPGESCLYGTFETESGSVPKNASVALFAIEDGHPLFPPLVTFGAGEDGTLRACAKIEPVTEIVAFAPGFAPASQVLHASDATRVDLQPFVLRPGVSVHGRVTAGNTPLVRAEVEARATAPGYEVRVDNGWLGWRAGRYVWSASRTETAADGSYEIAGLDPGEHSLRLCTVRQRDVAIDVQDVKTQRANLPGAVVDFALPAARLDLSFQSSGAPLCCVEVQVKAGDRMFMRRTDDSGKIGFLIQPELAYELTAARFGFSTIHTQLRGLLEGEHRPETLALEPQSELASLIVVDNQSSGTSLATFELRPRLPVDDAHVDVRIGIERDASTHKFVIPNVPAGSWRVTMRSGPELPGSRLSRNCERDELVQVPDHGAVEAQLAVWERGGLRVFTRTIAGEPVRATFRLLDTHGDPVEGFCVVDHPLPPPEIISDPAERQNVLNSPPSLAAYAPGQVVLYSSMCAGTADLIASADGMEDVKTRVSIVVGDITPVNVVFHPK